MLVLTVNNVGDIFFNIGYLVTLEKLIDLIGVVHIDIL